MGNVACDVGYVGYVGYGGYEGRRRAGAHPRIDDTIWPPGCRPFTRHPRLGREVGVVCLDCGHVDLGIQTGRLHAADHDELVLFVENEAVIVVQRAQLLDRVFKVGRLPSRPTGPDG